MAAGVKLPHARIAASAHLVDKLLVCRQKLYDEIRNIKCTGGQGSKTLRGDELKKRIKRKRRKRLKIRSCGRRNTRYVCGGHGAQLQLLKGLTDRKQFRLSAWSAGQRRQNRASLTQLSRIWKAVTGLPRAGWKGRLEDAAAGAELKREACP